MSSEWADLYTHEDAELRRFAGRDVALAPPRDMQAVRQSSALLATFDCRVVPGTGDETGIISRIYADYGADLAAGMPGDVIVSDDDAWLVDSVADLLGSHEVLVFGGRRLWLSQA